MFSNFKNKKIKIVAPVNGKVVDIENVPDPVFNEKMMGDGIAVQYSFGDVYAPISGEIITDVPSGHAFGIKHEQGLEILVHVGLETVYLQGEGFKMQKKVGDSVEAGDKIIEVNEEVLRTKQLNLITPIIVTNLEAYTVALEMEEGCEVAAGKTVVFACDKK